MAQALGEMYYLASLMEERRRKQQKQKQKQEKEGPQTIPTGLVFISPRVTKEFDTVIPSDTGTPVERVDSAGYSCRIM